MELWQMDVVGRFHLADGTEVKVITGIDDHSRFCVCARIVARATASPVVAALRFALAMFGVPAQILTDNGKVFTARFGAGPGPVLFDRICAANGIRHLLTAPYSPTTTGKVERFHRTLRKEFFGPNDYRFATITEAQEALDAWVHEYNHDRPHQSVGDRPPIERFRLAGIEPDTAEELDDEAQVPPMPATRPAGVRRFVDAHGRIGLNTTRYAVGRIFAGEAVEVVCRAGLVEILHDGVVVATHAERVRPDRGSKATPRRVLSAPRARSASRGPTVTRIADANGVVNFAGTTYRAGRAHARQLVQVAIVAGSVQLSMDGAVIRVHPIRHDRAKEHGAFSTPNGRPRNRRGAA
jgi:hypothetical protein